MRVLQLGKFYPIQGGVEKVMYDLMQGMSSKGIACDMMCASLEGERGQTVQVNDDGSVMTFRSWKKLSGTMIAPSMIWGLRKIANQYDIIHVHHPDPMAGIALWLSGYKGRVILHWHSDVVQQKYALMAYLPIQKWLISRAEVIIGTTPVYLQKSPYLRGVQDKTVCIPIGIEPIKLVPEARIEEFRQRYQGRKIIFSLGRLVPYKGYEHLIDAARYVGDDVIFLIGGTGPLENKLKSKICCLGLDDKVKLLGYIPDDDLPVYYHGCSIYCLSSVQKTEAFGIVQIEAMSCGKPVVATNIPDSGVSWVNEHGVSGLNVAPRDGKEIAVAINKILGNEADYQQFCRNSRRRYEEMFQVDRMIDEVKKVYG